MMSFEEFLSLAKKYKDNTMDMYYDINNYSLMPLLFMYAYRENLAEIKINIDANDSRTMVCLSTKDICECENLMKLLGNHYYGFMKDVEANHRGDEFRKAIESKFGGTWLKQSHVLFDKKEFNKYFSEDILLLPFEDEFEKIYSSNNVQNIGCYLDVSEDSPLLQIKNIFAKDDRKDFGSSFMMFWLFCALEETCKKTTKEELLGRDFDNQECEEHARREECEWLHYFDTVLDTVLNKRNKLQVNMPVELALLTEHLLNYKVGNIYNPFADAASVAVHSKRYSYNDHYYGDAPDEETWALGKLRMLVHNRNGNNFNVFDSYKWRNGSYERIIANIPFETKITDSGEPLDNFVIKKGIDNLTEEGKMVVIVPADFLSRANSFEIRKHIIDDNMLDAVVSLPRGIYQNISQIPVLLLISKKRKTDLVKFVYASNLPKKDLYCVGRFLFDQDKYIDDSYKLRNITYVYYSPYECISLDYYDPVKVNSNHFNEWKAKVTNALISYVDYNIDYTLYLHTTHLEHSTKITLKNLSEIVHVNVDEKGKGIIYNTTFLRNPSLIDVSSTDLQIGEYSDGFIKLNENAVVLSLSENLNPKFFDTRNGIIYMNPKLYCALKINEARIDVHYLINELGKDYVKAQLCDMADRKFRNLKDILSLYIYVPQIDEANSLSLQRQAYETEIMSKMNSMQMELVRLKDIQFNEYIKGLRQRKHRIQQIMNELCPAFSTLNRYRKNHNGVLNDCDIIAKRTNQNVSDYFDLIDKSLQKVENLITKLVDKEKWDDTEEINIYKFVLDYQKRNNGNSYKIQVYNKCDKSRTLTVKMNPDDLSTVFENITANAIKWGFTDKTYPDYTIKIMLFQGESSNHEIVLSISNNGTPIHSSMDRKHIFDWGYGSHTGFGTWQVKHIIEHYGGKVTLREHNNNQDDFQTEFLIQLPLIRE